MTLSSLDYSLIISDLYIHGLNSVVILYTYILISFSHWSPDYPARHAQVSGAVQIPPFSQAGSHTAKGVNGYIHGANSNT